MNVEAEEPTMTITTTPSEYLEAFNEAMRRFYDAFTPTAEEMRCWSWRAGEALTAWCRAVGLIDTPVEPQPRPWKVHTPGRYRQRSR